MSEVKYEGLAGAVRERHSAPGSEGSREEQQAHSTPSPCGEVGTDWKAESKRERRDCDVFQGMIQSWSRCTDQHPIAQLRGPGSVRCPGDSSFLKE